MIQESIRIQDPAPKMIFNTLSVGRIENLTKLLTCNSTMAVLKKIFLKITDPGIHQDPGSTNKNDFQHSQYWLDQKSDQTFDE